MPPDKIQQQYAQCAARAERFRLAIIEQLNQLLSKHQIALGVPMESRVKSWESVTEKLDRKQLELSQIESLDDLVGLRLILLFRSDLDSVEQLIRQTFQVLSSEDTGDRLETTQFGYQSKHFVICLPKEWLSVPSFADLNDLRAEIQLRSIAQHIWAAASHKLQYKQESSVPPPLRRSIHRISALLETVDLEFDRILAERADYLKTGEANSGSAEPLNVDLVSAILERMLPRENKDTDEKYDELLSELVELSINTTQRLEALIKENLSDAKAVDLQRVEERRAQGHYLGTTKERTELGVFFTHVGLVRTMLRKRFGATASKTRMRKKS